MIIYMVRHGETHYNELKLIQGHIDNPLNQKGFDQAVDASKLLIEKKVNIDEIISSPLIRAVQTATTIKDHLSFDKDIVIYHPFIERDFGDLDGMTIADAFPLIEAKYNGPNYESDQDLIHRTIHGILDLEKTYPNKQILAVVHSQVIKAVFVHLNPKVYSFTNFTIQNGEVVTIEVTNKNISIIK